MSQVGVPLFRNGSTQINGRPVKIDFVSSNDEVVPYANASGTRVTYQDGKREVIYLPKVKAR